MHETSTVLLSSSSATTNALAYRSRIWLQVDFQDLTAKNPCSTVVTQDAEHLATGTRKLWNTAVNGSVHTAHKQQHQRICKQICFRILCERGLGPSMVLQGQNKCHVVGYSGDVAPFTPGVILFNWDASGAVRCSSHLGLLPIDTYQY